MALLGCVGLMRSGKDLSFTLIKELYPNSVRVAFADKVKECVSTLFNITLEQLEEFKINNESVVLGGIFDYKTEEDYFTQYFEFTFRKILQRMGTEVGRNMFGENFWVNLAISKLPDGFETSKTLYVITDCRFENEINIIKQYNGKIIKINRELKEKSNHSSEKDFVNQADYIVDNNGTKEQLKEQLKIILEKKILYEETLLL